MLLFLFLSSLFCSISVCFVKRKKCSTVIRLTTLLRCLSYEETEGKSNYVQWSEYAAVKKSGMKEEMGTKSSNQIDKDSIS